MNTNFQTFHQMGSAISDFVKQATGRDNVQNIDMEHITVAQNHYYEDVDVSGHAVVFTAGAEGIPFEKCIVQIEPVQSGSGDPAPDNVRPITGWTGANVQRTGKNLLYNSFSQMSNWSETLQPNGDFPTTIGNKGYLLPTVPGETYTLSLGISATVFPTYCYLCAYSNGISSRSYAFSTANYNDNNYTFTAQENTMYYIRMGNTIDDKFEGTIAKISYAQLELGSTATAYEPYHGQTYDITFPSEAGTVYGGTLDVTTGTLVVDRAVFTVTSAKLSGLETGWNSTYGAWVRNLNYNEGITRDFFDGTDTVPCSSALCVVHNRGISSSQYRTSFFASGWTSYDDFSNAVASLEQLGTPMTYVAPLATPQTYHLTPVEIRTLLGQNNIWADTGSIEVKFTNLKELY